MEEQQEGYVMPFQTEMNEHKALIEVKELSVVRKVREAQDATAELNQLKDELAALERYADDRKTPVKVWVECSEGDGKEAKTKGLCEAHYRKALRLAKKLERSRGGRTPFYGTKEQS